MSLTFIGLAGIVALLVLMFFLGTPVGFAMGIIGFIGFSTVVSVNAGVNMVGSVVWSTFSQYGLTVIPLFIFMGQIAFYSGVNEKLYTAAYRWVGHIRGGLAMATVMACAAFSAICGSNAATAATMSTVALPQMKKYNYDPRLSTGTIASGSTLGVVIPPSVVLIVIGLSTEQSIARLFYGGFGAGIVLTVMLMLTVSFVCRIHPDWGPAGPMFTWKERFKSFFSILKGIISGDENDWHTMVITVFKETGITGIPKFSTGIKPIQLGHFDIQRNQIRGRGRCRMDQCLQPVTRFNDIISPFLQFFPNLHSNHLAVIHYQNSS